MPLAVKSATKEAIREMLDMGMERSVSSYCNPLRVVQKKDGKVRVCLDARYLNEIMEDDHEAPPLINEFIQKHHDTEFFSKIDLTHGYWQIKLHKESRSYTAFLYDCKLYQFFRIPFGLKDAGSAFMRALSLAVGEENKNISMYIDDVLISSKTFDEYIYNMLWLFDKLRKNYFTIKLDKCEVFRKSIQFLGFVLSADGIKPDPDNSLISKISKNLKIRNTFKDF